MRIENTKVVAQLAIVLLAAATQSAAQARPLHLDPNQPIETRITYLLSQLTVAEKASLMSTTAPAIERLGIPKMDGWNQSLHGVVWSEPTTMFPTNIGMAATWNPTLIERVSSTIHDEARAIYNLWRTAPGEVITDPQQGASRGQWITVTPDGRRYRHNGIVYRSPVINISRQPLWGRIHEAYGEDPHLTSRMAVAYVHGMQGNDPRYLKIAGTLKHYAMNNKEVDRRTLSAHVDERSMHEYYLPHFRAGIVEGGAQSIMSVYNKLNDVPGAANSWLMKEVLRDMWGFDGFGVPDSGAARDLMTTHAAVQSLEEAVAMSVKAGHNLDDGFFAQNIPGAIERGYLSVADLDRALRDVLRVRIRLGELDPAEMVPFNYISPSIIGSQAHRDLALETARQSMVLLRNDGNVLPLDRTAIRRIAVIGPHADSSALGIGYTGLARGFVKPIDGIRNKMAPGTQLVYARGSGITQSAGADAEAGYAEAVNAARGSDVAILFVGTNGSGQEALEGEGRDRTYLHIPEVQGELVRRVLAVQPRTIVVMVTAGPMSLTRPTPNGQERIDAPGVVYMFMAGEEGGNAVAEVLFGDYNPGGRLPYTVYKSASDVPGWEEYDVTKGYTYMYFRGQPDWAFGHGMSYTSFAYSNPTINASRIAADGNFTVSVDVRNTGTREGDEVVQLYVRDTQPPLARPIKELRGFERIALNPGETRTVFFTIPGQDFAYYDVARHAFVVHSGRYEAMIGASSADIRHTLPVDVTTSGQWAP